MSRRDQVSNPIFRSAFMDPSDEFNGLGRKPFIFDIVAPDGVTSVLPDGLKLVLHNNPESVSFSYSKMIERTQTEGGFVEFHWGEGLRTISLSMVTGGFKRLYSGMSNITGGGLDVGGTRRETIAYDKFLDMLALFHNNGAIYDVNGQIVFEGFIKLTFDGGVYLGWFDGFDISEDAEKPYQFEFSTNFTVEREIMVLRSETVVNSQNFFDARVQGQDTADRIASQSPLLSDSIFGFD